MIEKRTAWQELQQILDVQRLVFLDESSINTGMTRLYGRAKGKNRIVDYVPDVRFQRMSIVSSVKLNGEICPKVFRGSLNGEIFAEYIKTQFAPSLKPGYIVIWDNLQAHKTKGIAEAIQAVGATILYLPPYSPDFNPIELMWSKMKAYLRKAKARSIEALNEAIEAALGTVTLKDIGNWVAHNGYYRPKGKLL